MTTTRPAQRVQQDDARLARFDLVERCTHWLVAALFGVLIVTAIPLYFGTLFGIVLPRQTIARLHLWCGLALPVPIIVSLFGRWGAAMRADIVRINNWTRAERRWLRTLGRAPLRAGKFNPGQKLNATIIGATIFTLVVTGSMLQWFRFFPVNLRVNATFVHDVVAFSVVILITGHITMAVAHRDSLKSMFRGTISSRWASRHAPAWLDEIEQTDGKQAADKA